MTAPRQIVPGATYLITRRCTHRELLLKPCRQTNEIFRYCLGVAVEQTGIRVHAVCCMSNHWHAVVTDPFARLPQFLECFHKLMAKAMNAALGRSENFWSSDKPSVVRLMDDEVVLEKMAYVISNPTSAGLVRAPSEWPGVVSQRLEEVHEATRPHVYFDPDGDMPEHVVIRVQPPPIFPRMTLHDLALRLRDAVAVILRRARASLRARGRDFVGRFAILQGLLRTPRSVETNRTLIPRVAAHHSAVRRAALLALRKFGIAYRAALRLWRSGERDVLFPFGTYALRVHCCARCEAARTEQPDAGERSPPFAAA